MSIRTKDTRAPLALDGAEAQRVRALIEAGHGRPKILDTLRAEGFDVSERQIRTLYDHLRSERRETRAAVQEQVVDRAVAALAPGRSFWGCEIEERYAEVAARRLEQAEHDGQQVGMFGPPP
jgi:hypothetical protein